MIENLKYLPGLGSRLAVIICAFHLMWSFQFVRLLIRSLFSLLKYNVYHANYTKMRMLLSTINWERDMENYLLMTFGTSFQDEIVKVCVPLARPCKSKNTYMNKEALKLKNKKNHL